MIQDDTFENMNLFHDFSEQQLDIIRPLFLLKYLPAGTELFEQGEQTEYLYLVLEGEIQIRYKPEDGPALTVVHVQPEGLVGWSAAIGNPRYTSSAVCVADCKLICTRNQDLRQLFLDHQETGMLLLERLADLISERLQSTHQHVKVLLEQGLLLNMGNT